MELKNWTRLSEPVRNFELVKPFMNRQLKYSLHLKKLISVPFEQFVDSFDLPFLWKYVIGKSFDLYRYASDLKSGAVLTPKGVRPLFGNLYLPHNAEILARRIKSQRSDVRRKYLLTDAGWLAPAEAERPPILDLRH